jgi:uncharacterized membrane protein YeaQ/YmgE (transglycosylase-associated protein family)
MEFIVFILIGVLVGWLAGKIFRGGGYGFIMNAIIGIVGGVLGGWLFGNFFGEGWFGGIVTALLGALILLWIASMIKK